MDETGSKLWFCRWDKRFEIGPLNDDELLAMVAAGRIKSSDEVRRGWLGPWLLISQIPGLAASLQSRLAAPSAATSTPPIPPPLPVSHPTLATASNLSSPNDWHRDPRARIAIALACVLVLSSLLGAGLFAWSHRPGHRNQPDQATATNPSAVPQSKVAIQPVNNTAPVESPSPQQKASPTPTKPSKPSEPPALKPPVSFDGRPYTLPKAQHGHSRAGLIWLWDVKTGKEIRCFRGHERHVVSVALSADGSRLLSGARDGSARMWGVATGEELWKFQTDTPEVRTVLISPNGKTAVFSQADGEVLFVDAVTGKGLKRYNFPRPWGEARFKDLMADLAFSSDGLSMIGKGEWGDIGWWDAQTGKQLFKDSEDHHVDANSLAVDFRADFKHVLTANQGRIQIMDVQAKAVRNFHTATSLEPKRTYGGNPFPDIITSVAISDNGRLALSGSERGKVRLWDVLSGKEIREFSGHDRLVTSVRFTPDQKLAMSTSWDGSAKSWDLEQDVEVHRFCNDLDSATCLAIANDGRTCAVGGGTTIEGVPRMPRFDVPLLKSQPVLVIDGLPRPNSLALDVEHGHLYWAHNSTIFRSQMDGSDLQELITGLKSPSCLQLDLKRQRMYWRVQSSPHDEIHHARLDGSDCQVTILDPRYANFDKRRVLVQSGMFVIEPVEGKFYFVSQPPRICRCNYDGTHVEDIVELGLSEYVTIAVDGVGGQLFWANKERGEIHRSNLDGTAVRTIHTNLGSRIDGIVFDDTLQKLYWTEEDHELIPELQGRIARFNSMCRFNSDGSQHERLIVVDNPSYDHAAFVPPHGKLFDIVDNDGMFARFHAAFTLDGPSGWLYWIKRERIERVRMYEPPPAPPAAN